MNPIPPENEIRLKRIKPGKKLTEVGGLALVEFHLARRGSEFTRTMRDSDCGDIWAECRGRRVAIEVKSTFEATGWHVKRKQKGADFYCLVHLEEGRCFLLRSDEMQSLVQAAPDIFPGIALVKRSSLPRDSLEDWTRLGLNRMPRGGWNQSPTVRQPYKSTRTVRHVLATGEVKVYVYPAGT